MPVRSEFDFYMRSLINGRLATNIFHKFGRSESVTTTFTPLALGGIYNMPTPSNATRLRVRAGDAEDSASGLGARQVDVLGVLQDGTFRRTSLATAGASPSEFTAATYMRLFRIQVTLSGTYATAEMGSHFGDIIIEDEAGEFWGKIDANTYPRGQSEIGFFTVPTGFDALIFNIQVNANSKKVVDFIMFTRDDMLNEVAPFSAKRMSLDFVETESHNVFKSQFPLGVYKQNTDIGFMVKSENVDSVEVDYEIVLMPAEAT